MPFVSAVLLLGGRGKRFDPEKPKQFFLLQEKPLFLYPLKIFLESNLFQEILLVIPKGCFSEVKSWIYPYQDQIKLVEGGKTRQASSYQALLSCNPSTEYVVIHDAARPFLSFKILQENVRAVQKHKAVNTCIPAKSTITYSKKEKAFIENIPPRDQCFEGQTPQSFSYSLIRKAHEIALAKDIQDATDDCQLVLPLHPIKIALGRENNFKITTKQDLHFAQFLLEEKKLVPGIL